MQRVTRDKSSKSKGVPLDDDDRTLVLDLIARSGEPDAARALNVGRHTLARLAAGLPVQRATAECVRNRLASHR